MSSPDDLVVRLLERAALDGSTCLPAALAGAEDGLRGRSGWAGLEERVAEQLARLVAAGDERAVLVVGAPRGSRPAAVVDPLVDRVESTGGRVLRARGDQVEASLPAVHEADLVLLERADLLGLADAAQLVEAARDGSRLVLVGDPALPPAPGPGQLLVDLVGSGTVPVVEAPTDTDAVDQLALLVRNVRAGTLPRLPAPAAGQRPELVVTVATDAGQAVHRAVQLVTDSIPRVFGTAVSDLLVLAPRAGGDTGTEALRSALAEAGAGQVEVATCEQAVGRAASAIVLVLGAESAGSLTGDLLVAAATEAAVHLSVVHQAGPALAEAVARRPHRTRRTRLAGLLADLPAAHG